MEFILWSVVLIVSLVALVKGADWLIDGAENIGVSFGLPAFVVGVTIVALGTSLPELISSLSAVLKGTPEIVIANAIGSNIANILLIVGVTAVVGKKMVVDKNLIDLDIPLLAASTILFLIFAWDGSVNTAEAIILVLAYGFYFLYILLHKDEKELTKRAELMVAEEIKKTQIRSRDSVAVAGGGVALALGANYLVDSILVLSSFLGLTAGMITITVVALGTSLPELFVSVQAVREKKSETALGNIFGSNVFNILLVVGIPGLLGTLPIGESVMQIGIPVLIAATFMFVISGISRQIHMWEGTFYLVIYGVFIVKLLGLF